MSNFLEDFKTQLEIEAIINDTKLRLGWLLFIKKCPQLEVKFISDDLQALEDGTVNAEWLNDKRIFQENTIATHFEPQMLKVEKVIRKLTKELLDDKSNTL